MITAINCRLSSLHRVARALHATISQTQAAAERAGVAPALQLDFAAFYDDDQVEQIRTALAASPRERAA